MKVFTFVPEIMILGLTAFHVERQAQNPELGLCSVHCFFKILSFVIVLFSADFVWNIELMGIIHDLLIHG